MEEQEIINRVAGSALQVFDLEDFYPEGDRAAIDISAWLWQGFVVKEKEFRDTLKNHDWQQYSGKYIALFCSTDAIIPAWAYMLITVYLQPVAKKVVQGSMYDIDVQLYEELLAGMDYSDYEGKPLIVKGCAKKPVPQEAYVMAVQKLMPVAKSLMFGEACSSVPLYKKR